MGTAVELEDFVAEVIGSLVRGVLRCQEELAASGALVCPAGLSFDPKGVPGQYYSERDGRVSEAISFDVAVTARSTGNVKAGASFKVTVVDASLGGDLATVRETVSRVKFQVPVLLPALEYQRD